MFRSSSCSGRYVLSRRIGLAAALLAGLLAAGGVAGAAPVQEGERAAAEREAVNALARRAGQLAQSAIDGPAEPATWDPDLQQQGVELIGYAIKTIAMLGLLCVMGYAVVRFLGPRVGPLGGREEDVIQVKELKRLDPKTTLYLVEVAGRHVLLAVSDREVRPIGDVALDEAAIARKLAGKAPRPEGPRSFGALLKSRPLRPLAAGPESKRQGRTT